MDGWRNAQGLMGHPQKVLKVENHFLAPTLSLLVSEFTSPLLQALHCWSIKFEL